jgi:hypothetical protein
MIRQDPQKLTLLPDGIYIGLSSERYHADPALGSSNIRDLRKGANLYWHKSRMNPNRPKDKKTPSKILGTAVHRLLLDGMDAYEADFVRGPYGPDDDLSPGDKSSLTKAAKAKLLQGQELLSQEDFDFVLGCKDVLDRDPDLQGCLDNGLSEVSIFWTRKDLVRCKARLDKLKIRGIGDLKTIANERERPLDQACLLDIGTYRYDIPVAHYSEGRRRMAGFLDRGKVFTEDGEELLAADFPQGREVLDFLYKCAAEDHFGFQLVFIPKQGAPDAWSCTITPVIENPIYAEACVDIEAAIDVYKAALAKYGTSRWLPGHSVEEVTPDMLPFGFGKRRPAGVR